MEAVASVVGLLAAGVKVYGSLHQFISSCIDAPLAAHTLCDEVRDFRYALTKLQPYVDGSLSISLLGASTTDVDHLSLTLAACVVTFSRLEKRMDRIIAHGRMSRMDRLRWSQAEPEITQLVYRLQQHKSTMTLLLTIWIRYAAPRPPQLCDFLSIVANQVVVFSESLTEAESCRRQIDAELAIVIPHLYEAGQPGPRPQIQPSADTSATTSDILSSIQETATSSIMTATSPLNQYRRSFEFTLSTSRPYRRTMNNSTLSLGSSQRRGMRWSLFSGGSNDSAFSLPLTAYSPGDPRMTLAKIPNIARIPLPVHMDSLYNPCWYGVQSVIPYRDSNITRSIGSFARHFNNPDSALIEASKKGERAVVLRALILGANIETRNDEGYTALACAIRAQHEVIVRILLNEGANIEGWSVYEMTPLHIAAGLDRDVGLDLPFDIGDERDRNLSTGFRAEAIVALLLHRGADIGVRDHWGNTALLHAVIQGHHTIVRLLLDMGADIEERDKSGDTLLHCAVDRDHTAVLEVLLGRGANMGATDKDGNNPFQRAVIQGHQATVALLLGWGADIEEKNQAKNTPLHIALDHDHYAIVEKLLDQGADIEAKDKDENTPLHRVVIQGNGVTIPLLLDRGANIEGTAGFGRTVLHSAVDHDRSTVLEVLLDRGADIEAKDAAGNTPLHHAVLHDRAPIIGLLLDRGADIKAVDKVGNTPLHHAALHNRQKILALLLDRGADIEAKGRFMYSPLNYAIDNDHTKIVEILLNRGANVEARDLVGNTPLHYAAFHNRLLVIGLLLDRGAVVEVWNSFGSSPLLFAVMRGHKLAVKQLFRHGASLGANTKTGETVLQLAGDEDVLTLLHTLLRAQTS